MRREVQGTLTWRFVENKGTYSIHIFMGFLYGVQGLGTARA